MTVAGRRAGTPPVPASGRTRVLVRALACVPRGPGLVDAIVRRGRRWLRPQRVLRIGLLLVLLPVVMSALLAGAAAAAPVPPPAPGASTPPVLLGPETDPLLRPDGPLAPKPPLRPPPAQPADPSDSPLLKDAAQRERDAKKKAEAAYRQRVADYMKEQAAQDGILGSFGVTDREGNPVTSYRIYADTGDWTEWDLSAAHFMVEMLFLGNKWAIIFPCFLISWGLSFSLAGLLLKPALHVSSSLYGGVVVQIGLPGLALTMALVTAAWQLMFGSRVRGWGELVAALVISALTVGALASPPQLLLSKDSGAIAVVRDLALEAAALVLDQEAIEESRPTTDAQWERSAAGGTVGAQVRTASSALARPIIDALVDAFVARPAMLLSYGRVFDGKCGKAFRSSRIEQAMLDQTIDEALNKAVKNDSDFLKKFPVVGDLLGGTYETVGEIPKKVVREALTSNGPIGKFEKECVGGSKAAKKASVDKVGGAFFMFVASLLVSVFLVVVVCGFLFGQIRLALEAMLAKVALAVGVLPGPGRAWLWDRAQAIVRSLALILASVVCLAILIVLINGVLNAPEGDLPGGLTVRFVAIDFVCVAMFLYRKRLGRSTRSMVLRARQRLGASPLGGATAPASLESPRKRRGLGKGLLVGGLMLGALAASGGTSAALGGTRLAGGRLAARLGGTAVRGTSRAVGEVARVGAKGAGKTALFGLKATAGLPVYGPRAARHLRATAARLPQQIATGKAAALRDVQRTFAPMDAFVNEGIHNVRSLGRIVTGRGGLGPYTPPRPPTPRRIPRPAPRPVPPVPPAPPAPAPPPPRSQRQRPRLAPATVPPANATHALLQRRLHRARNPRPQTLPPASARRGNSSGTGAHGGRP
ncbi:hypothetical protein GCM10010334_77390 [Streptomyces finlayi]|uniref:Uncharacterized protein n=1 Tax=Streptomyces finlayi TaxID=67296 RepID=A0A918X7R4_9ACTN|nr:hypothetical protein GCM10010334_77390 [Streptomyces finlayi]